MDKEGRQVKNKRTKFRAFPYAGVAPYLIIYLVFSLFPILMTIGMSFTNWTVGKKVSFVGLQNYLLVLRDKRFIAAMGNILIFVVIIVPILIFAGLLIANILTSKIMFWKNQLRVIMFLPYLLMPVAAGVIFGQMFARQTGMVNKLLMAAGLIKNNIYWTGQAWPARILVILIVLWKYCGYTALFFIAGIMNISQEVYEAAELDGVNPVQRLFGITLPLLKPVFKFVCLTTIINTFQMFDELVMLFSNTNGMTVVGGPANAVLTPIWLLYDTAFSTMPRYGYAAAVAIVTFIVIALVSFFTGKIMGKDD